MGLLQSDGRLAGGKRFDVIGYGSSGGGDTATRIPGGQV